MNRNQLTILLVLVVAFGVAGLVVYNKQNQGRREGNVGLGKKLLPNLPVNDVGQISIKSGTNNVNLTKKKDDIWRVRERQDYPANYQEISDLLLKLKDLKVVQTEDVGPSQLARLSLVPGEGTNAATVVDFKDQNGKAMSSLVLGKKHMRKSTRPSPMGDMGDEGWPDGRYVKVGGESRAVALVSDPLASLEPKPEQWLSKDFIKIEKPRSVTVDFPAATNSWSITRETESGDWKLSEAKPEEKLDSTKVSAVSSSLSSPSFSDVRAGAEAAQAGLTNASTIRIQTFDGFDYTLKVGPKVNDSYPVSVMVDAKLNTDRTPGKDEKPADKEKLDKEHKESLKKLEEKLAQEKSFQNWVYFISSWTLDPFMKERPQLMVEKKDEAASSGSSTNAPGTNSFSLPTAADKDGDGSSDSEK